MKNISFILAYCFFVVCGIFGLYSNLAFAAPPPYDAATCEATDVTSTSATLNGKVYNYFSESPMTAWFQYGTASGFYSSTSSTQSVSGNEITIVSIGITGLSPNTPYYYRIVAQNSELSLYGLEKSFTTLSAMATPTTIAVPTPSSTSGCHSASGKVTDAVTKNGIENALVIGGMGISFTDANGSYSWSDPEEILCCGDIYTFTASADGYISQSQSIEIEPYIEGTLNFELCLISATPTPIVSPTETPDVITDDATNVTSSSATLHGRILKYVTIGAKWFEYGTVSGALDRTVATYGTGESETYDMVSADISGLSPVTTYYYRIVGQYKDHNTYGDEKSFITLSATPAVTPTPVCEAESVETSPKTLKLQREESSDITVTVTGSEDCPVAGETVTAKIQFGMKRIVISPQSADTNVAGQAIFTITATKKTGNAKVRFVTTSGLKATVVVKVKKD